MQRAPSIGFYAALALFTAIGARAQIALPKESPFMPAPGAVAADQPASDTFELKGFSSTGKKILVCVYDSQAKRSHWIAVDATVEGIKIVAFDAAKEEATITVGGQKKTLRMRKPSVAAGTNTAGTAAAGFASPVTAPMITQGIPQPPPAPGSIAQQEVEARMLVSDLLEIGIQQRKAYEEAQKKADQERAAGKKN
jgi:hypothetical protein